MKIKLFEEYSEDLDFSNYKILSSDENSDLVNSSRWLILSEYELKKIKTLAKVKEYWIGDPTKHTIYYNLILLNDNTTVSNIDLIKLEDDYYVIDYLYTDRQREWTRYYIKCDQLQELLGLLKYISEI